MRVSCLKAIVTKIRNNSIGSLRAVRKSLASMKISLKSKSFQRRRPCRLRCCSCWACSASPGLNLGRGKSLNEAVESGRVFVAWGRKPGVVFSLTDHSIGVWGGDLGESRPPRGVRTFFGQNAGCRTKVHLAFVRGVDSIPATTGGPRSDSPL